VALWEAEKTIGTGKKYAHVEILNAVEKKKKAIIDMGLVRPEIYPLSFFGE